MSYEAGGKEEEGESQGLLQCPLSGSSLVQNKPLVLMQGREHSHELHEAGVGLGGSNCSLQTYNQLPLFSPDSS